MAHVIQDLAAAYEHMSQAVTSVAASVNEVKADIANLKNGENDNEVEEIVNRFHVLADRLFGAQNAAAARVAAPPLPLSAPQPANPVTAATGAGPAPAAPTPVPEPSAPPPAPDHATGADHTAATSQHSSAEDETSADRF